MQRDIGGAGHVNFNCDDNKQPGKTATFRKCQVFINGQLTSERMTAEMGFSIAARDEWAKQTAADYSVPFDKNAAGFVREANNSVALATHCYNVMCKSIGENYPEVGRSDFNIGNDTVEVPGATIVPTPPN